MKNTDNRIHNDMRVNPAFLFAAMFWYPRYWKPHRKLRKKAILAYYDAFALAMNDVLDEACRSLAIPETSDLADPRYLAVAATDVPSPG